MRTHNKQSANRRALEVTLRILKKQGWFEDVDAVRIQTLRSLADELDRDGGNAQMWRTYREAVEDLMRSDDDGNDIDALIAQINSRAPVGDPPEAG
jgi:hypothetical protein